MALKADVLVTNVALFDGEAFKDGTYDVRVENGRFSAVEPAGTLQKRESETVVDATGHTMTPGIIDCHIHSLVNNAGSLEGFATHHAPLENAAEMYATFQKKQDGCIKVILQP